MNSSVQEAIKWVKDDFKSNPRKFDASVDLSLNINVNLTKGTVFLPHGSGKKLRVALIAHSCPEGVEVDAVGYDDLINDIKNKKILYDRYFIQSENIKNIASLAKILGPKGLMPSLKNGSIIASDNDWNKINDFRQSRIVEVRADKNNVVNISVGRVSYAVNELETNFNAVIDYIKQFITEKSKKAFSSVFLTSTMGNSKKIDLYS